MSRPFSYNDENFTVINNILFVHLNIGSKSYAKDDVLIAIPPKLFDRMVSFSQYAYGSALTYNGSGVNMYVACDEYGNLLTKEVIPSATNDRLMYTWFLLKDI